MTLAHTFPHKAPGQTIFHHTDDYKGKCGIPLELTLFYGYRPWKKVAIQGDFFIGKSQKITIYNMSDKSKKAQWKFQYLGFGPRVRIYQKYNFYSSYGLYMYYLIASSYKGAKTLFPSYNQTIKPLHKEDELSRIGGKLLFEAGYEAPFGLYVSIESILDFGLFSMYDSGPANRPTTKRALTIFPVLSSPWIRFQIGYNVAKLIFKKKENANQITTYRNPNA